MRVVETEVPAHYLFIVARDRPDILTRVRERLRDDVRIEVIVDRRHGQRRTSAGSRTPERRCADRRRATRHWDDLSVYPTLVVQKRVESYAELQQKMLAAGREAQRLREDNERVSAENARLRETIGWAEDVIGKLLGRFRERLNPPPRSAS